MLIAREAALRIADNCSHRAIGKKFPRQSLSNIKGDDAGVSLRVTHDLRIEKA